MQTAEGPQPVQPLLDQFRVQYVRGEDLPRSRYFTHLKDAQVYAAGLRQDPEVTSIRIDQRSVTKWAGVE